MPSGLFGIVHSNREDDKHWTKNCFNSSFPTALACYMMEHNMPAIYAKLAVVDNELKVVCEEISINELFNCGTMHPQDLDFHFESKFNPYQAYCIDQIDPIDLVVKDTSGNFLAPVEVKLTVLPTSATADKPESEWASEIVVRTATTSYLALGVWDAVKDHRDRIRDIFGIGSWTNDYEMAHKTANLRDALNVFEREFIDYQRPLVMQPIWKTQGQTPLLCDEAFDIVVWSNLAFSRLFIENEIKETMSRPMRATARMARCIWELSRSGRVRMEDIYRQMTFGQQNDKEANPAGKGWRKYISTDRVLHPIVPKTAIREILAPNYTEMLKPERRLDQTLYYDALISAENG